MGMRSKFWAFFNRMLEKIWGNRKKDLYPTSVRITLKNASYNPFIRLFVKPLICAESAKIDVTANRTEVVFRNYELSWGNFNLPESWKKTETTLAIPLNNLIFRTAIKIDWG